MIRIIVGKRIDDGRVAIGLLGPDGNRPHRIILILKIGHDGGALQILDLLQPLVARIPIITILRAQARGRGIGHTAQQTGGIDISIGERPERIAHSGDSSERIERRAHAVTATIDRPVGHAAQFVIGIGDRGR